MSQALTVFPPEFLRFVCPFCGRRSQQNVLPVPECLHCVTAAVAEGQGTHSGDSRDRCEIHCASPCPANPGESPPQDGHPPGACGRCPGVQIPAPAIHAAVWVATLTGYRPPHPETEYLCRPFQS